MLPTVSVGILATQSNSMVERNVWQRSDIVEMSVNMATNEVSIDGDVLPHSLNIEDIHFSGQLVSVLSKLRSSGDSPIKQFQRRTPLTAGSGRTKYRSRRISCI